MNVELSQIDLRDNSRADAREGIAELMQSLKDHGQLQNIVVRETGKKTKPYELVAGFRRYNAAKKLGWKTLAAFLLTSGDEAEKESLLVNLTENIQRVDVKMFDVGRYVELLKKEYNMTDSEIASRLGKPPGFVHDAHGAFKRLPAEFADKVVVRKNGTELKKGLIPSSYATAILSAAGRGRLSKPETAKLLRAASDDKFNKVKITKALKFVASGVSVDDSLEAVDNVSTFSVAMTISKREEGRLRAQHGHNLPNIVRRIVTGKLKETIKLI